MDNIDISDKFGIAMRINTRSLASLCMKNTDFSEICRNEDFWRAKYQQDFGLRDYRNRPVTGSWLEDYKRGEDRLDDYNAVGGSVTTFPAGALLIDPAIS